MKLVDLCLKTHPPVALFDNVLIPVIATAATDHPLGFLEAGHLNLSSRDYWIYLMRSRRIQHKRLR
jgi:hypothetical protein